MRKWFLIVTAGILFIFPSMVYAQTTLALSSLTVQLWPEYDQPSMLVITDFEVSPVTKFPASVTFRIPQEANLIAVAAYDETGALVNAIFDGPTSNGDWQTFTITLNSAAARFEYYQPITFNGEQRIFSYLWDGMYAVNAFDIRVLEPLDTTSLVTTPDLPSISQENDLKYFEGDPIQLAQGEQFTLNLNYTKTSNELITSTQGVQPVSPVDANTPGRVSLSNYVPYLLAGFGVVLIIGGFAYYWRAGRDSALKKTRRRSQSHVEKEENNEELYCPQCGTRAKPGDRFCRVCGGRLRHQEE